eukprot:TRINITY_DN20722_c1_g1_i1.p1 TRINITY_DN20722_c1_g1~~TRINITY_DN20722_c1_g1_i1.p1  ORF type:complete len:381 (+),score=72.51 TRINITY_DN20722_c1_g1_i1:84-1226(+)
MLSLVVDLTAFRPMASHPERVPVPDGQAPQSAAAPTSKTQSALTLLAQDMLVPVFAEFSNKLVEHQNNMFMMLATETLTAAPAGSAVSSSKRVRSADGLVVAAAPSNSPATAATESFFGNTTDIDRCIQRLDKPFRGFATRWKFKILRRQSDVQKYEDMELKHAALHGRFLSESDFAWQFPAEYKQLARQTVFERDVLGNDDVPMDGYDIDAVWRELRQRHAEECREFVLQHTRCMTAVAQAASSLPNILRDMEADLAAEAARFGSAFTRRDLEFIWIQFKELASIVRKSIVAEKSRDQHKKKEAERKRDRDLKDKADMFEKCSANTLLALTAITHDKRTIKDVKKEGIACSTLSSSKPARDCAELHHRHQEAWQGQRQQ